MAIPLRLVRAFILNMCRRESILSIFISINIIVENENNCTASSKNKINTYTNMTYYVCIHYSTFNCSAKKAWREDPYTISSKHAGPLHSALLFCWCCRFVAVVVLCRISFNTVQRTHSTIDVCNALNTSHTFRIIESASLTATTCRDVYVNSLTMQLHRHFPVLICLARTTEQNAKHANHRWIEQCKITKYVQSSNNNKMAQKCAQDGQLC